jgi:putative transposase
MAAPLYNKRMTTTPAAPYKGHRFPAEIIAHAVWLTFRFPLSYRQVEEILAARGIVVSYEAIRAWCRKFGQTYANALHRRCPQPGDTWHRDEVFLPSTASLITYGGPWISMAMCWIFW